MLFNYNNKVIEYSYHNPHINIILFSYTCNIISNPNYYFSNQFLHNLVVRRISIGRIVYFTLADPISAKIGSFGNINQYYSFQFIDIDCYFIFNIENVSLL